MMARAAALFPGQGSQYLGMGQALYERSARVREVFEWASELLGWDLFELCARGPEEELRETSRSQPAIFTLSYAMYELLHDAGWEPAMVAGHSVGEFTALAAAGGLSFEEGLRAVAKRGELMAQAGAKRPGAMLAVLGAATEAVEEKVKTLQQSGVIAIANYNCPGQVVVSLERELLAQARRELTPLAKKVVELPVSGAFHSRLMAEAQARFAEFLAQAGLSFERPRVPILLNATLAPSRDPVEIKEALIAQMTEPVRWQQSVLQLIRSGVGIFIEVGPKDVLTKLVRRIERNCLALAADGHDPRKVIAALGSEVR
ncbi:MAG: ACP S-malonyltransferase [Candidatus Bipolaricaulia bacterium]